jgi:hypothetical protein
VNEPHIPNAHRSHLLPCGCSENPPGAPYACPRCGATYGSGLDGPEGFPFWRCYDCGTVLTLRPFRLIHERKRPNLLR